MPKAKPSPSRRSHQVRVRILAGSAIALGPGKADLLEAIASTGSISGAAREMRMSYRRAWILVDTMNRCWREPLVAAAKGGVEGGGAHLTPAGRAMLSRYRSIVRAAQKSFSRYVR